MVTQGRQCLNIKTIITDTTASEQIGCVRKFLTGPADGQGLGDECNHEGDEDDGRGHEQ